MKIKGFLFALTALAVMSGCNDDEGGDKMSTLTPEEHKANLEQSGLNVVNQLESMSDLGAVKVMLDFNDLMETTDYSNDGVAGVIKPILALNEGASVAFVLKASTIDESSLSQLFDDEAGIYTYNAEYGTWDKTVSDDEITYHFPTSGSVENNATLSFTNFEFITTDNVDIAEVSNELPTLFDAELTVDEVSLITFTFNAAYDADGIPTSVSERWTVEEYNLTTSVSRSTSTIEIDQSFTLNDANILSSHFSSAGSFSYGNMKEDGESGDYYEQDILESSNAWIAVDNLKLEGNVNWKGLLNGQASFEDIESEEQYFEKEAEAMNNNMSLKLKYNDSNEVIATGEAYVKTVEDSYGIESWDLDFRMKFADGSYMDDSYFGENDFIDLIESFEDMIEDAEENYEVTID
jgi:hypothetical protein